MKMRNLISVMTIITMGVAAVMGSCTQQQTNTSNDKLAQSSDSTVDSVISTEDACLAVIEKYLVDSIASQYSEAEMCIPLLKVVDIDDSDSTDVKVWGSFWVFNYNLSGDTLKTVSGGNHPGLFHLNTVGKECKITSFDQVADGSDNIPSAKRIFGDKYEAFSKIESNDKQRDTLRTQVVKDYVKKNNIAATMYQDYGWPPVKLQ